MRALLPDTSLPDTSLPDTGAASPATGRSVDLGEWYARGWLGVGGIRADMISGLDGASSVDGRSAGLQTPGDNRVFATLRELADVVVVGSGTAAAEGYGPVAFAPDARRRRRDRGLPDELPIAVVSRSLRLDLSAPLFADPARRPLVLTVATADLSARGRLARVAEVIACGENDLDFAAARQALLDRGLRHVVCEGGPTMLSSLIAAGELDELCLSLTPFLSGPGADRIVVGSPWTGRHRLDLVGVLEEDGALFLRYRTVRVAT